MDVRIDSETAKRWRAEAEHRWNAEHDPRDAKIQGLAAEVERLVAALRMIANGPVCACTYEAGDTADCPAHPTDENANPIDEPWFDEREIARAALGDPDADRR